MNLPPAGTYDALLVDDDPALRLAMARVFRSEGFRCELAADGREAQQLLAERRFDLVVTDLAMPNVNGHRLAVELMAQSNRPAVIVVTGIAEPKLERDLRQRGVDDVLLKPVDYAQLVDRARALIDSRRALVQSCSSSDIPHAATTSAEPQVDPTVTTQPHDDHRDSGTVPACANAIEVNETTNGRSDLSTAVVASCTAQPAQPSIETARTAEQPYEMKQLIGLMLTHNLSSLWAAVTFAAGVLMGWYLAIWSR